MEAMEMLLKLQESYDKFRENKKILKDGSYIYLLKKMKKEFEGEKHKYDVKKKAIDEIMERYAIISNELRKAKQQIDDNDKILYTEAGSDLKFIEKLQNKIEKSKHKLKEIEDEAIELLEKEEKLKFDIEALKLELINLKNNFYNYKESINNKISKAKENIKIIEVKIESQRSKISKDILRNFDKIYEARGNSVAKLNGDVCSECRMKVSAMTLDNIYRESGITYCDNCGRVLYYKNPDKIKKAK